MEKKEKSATKEMSVSDWELHHATTYKAFTELLEKKEKKITELRTEIVSLEKRNIELESNPRRLSRETQLRDDFDHAVEGLISVRDSYF